MITLHVDNKTFFLHKNELLSKISIIYIFVKTLCRHFYCQSKRKKKSISVMRLGLNSK